MSTAARIAIAIVVVLSIWTLIHVYVVARLWNLPSAPTTLYRRWLVAIAVALWASFPLAMILARSLGRAALALEVVGSLWVGVVTLLFLYLFAADVLTLFGFAGPRAARIARWAAIGVAAAMSLAALLQGTRAPVVGEHEVRVAGLRPELDGLVIAQISDLHLSRLLGRRWIAERVAQVEALAPDLIAVTGDVVDRDASVAEALVSELRRLHAPYGVWGVTGNHEYYAGLERALAVFERAGIHVLRDTSAEAGPGLVVAGVDDLTARRQFGTTDNAVSRALGSRPAGTTIYLCHSPWQAEEAAALGADLMLSGHTHAGQIWPVVHLVRFVYPHVTGRYDIDGMTLIVSRGTGFWGPPMRLFWPAEIVKITLRRG